MELSLVDNEFYCTVAGEARYLDVKGEITDLPYSLVAPAWMETDDTLTANYVECLSERYADRRNDVYEDDLVTSNSGSRRNEEKQYAGHYGYDVVPAPGHIVRCWYCNEEFTFFRDWFGKDDASAKQGFVVAMLVHYYEHRSNGDLPYVTTYFPGRAITTPSGKVYTKPGVVRTWRINGKLLGSPAKSHPKCDHEDLVCDACRI